MKNTDIKNTYIYVDGLNLYYQALRKNPDLKWLNILKLCQNILDDENKIERVKYFTSNVLGRIDQDAPRRQHQYLRVLGTLPEIEIFRGKMISSEENAHINYASRKNTIFKPMPWFPIFPRPKTVNTIRIEEKGSDVSLGAHLVHDAHLGKFDVAAVITNDTDLCEAIRITTEELKIPVGLITPVFKPATSLTKVTSFVRHIDRNRLLQAQFPDQVNLVNGEVIKRNEEWK